MKKCDRCGGSGLASMGVFSLTVDCPDCNGSGWVDPKVQGPAPGPAVVPIVVPELAPRPDSPAPAPASRFKPRPKKR